MALETRHEDKITEDVSSRIWTLLGQGIATVLERAKTDNMLKEERVSAQIEGWIVSGQFDLYGFDTLWDYKVVGMMSYKLGLKQEWVAQNSIYAWLLHRNGFEVKKSQNILILRDWVKSKTFDPEYPPAPIHVLDIPLWPLEKTEHYIVQRIRAHQEALIKPDDALPVCTPEERWERPTTWAVIKGKNKRAYRVFDNESSAADMAGAVKGSRIEMRQGGSVRCQSFCRALPFCNIGQSLVKKEAVAA